MAVILIGNRIYQVDDQELEPLLKGRKPLKKSLVGFANGEDWSKLEGLALVSPDQLRKWWDTHDNRSVVELLTSRAVWKRAG